MKRLIGTISAILLVILLFTGISPVQASDGPSVSDLPSIRLELAKQTVNQGEQFVVLVQIKSYTPTRGAQFSLSFDPRLVSVVDIKEGNYYAGPADTDGGTTWFMPGVIDNKTGTVKGIAVAMLGAIDTAPAEAGTLAVITMAATAEKVVGTSELNLSEVILITPDIAELSNVTAGDSRITLAGEGVDVSTLPPVTIEDTTTSPPDKTASGTPDILLDVPPSVATQPATDISYCGATANGYLSIGDAAEVSVYFMWRPNVPDSGNHPEYTTTPQLMTQSWTFSANINGLNTGLGPDTPYEFQALGEGSGYTPSGAVLSFRTSVTMIPDWDVNGDGKITIGDTSKIGLVWGYIGQNGWIRADVSHDGKITIGDVSKVGLHWNEAPVINVQASDGTYTDRINITWLNAYGATGYKLYRNTVNTPPANPIATLPGTSYDDYSVSIGTTYYYWVKAYNATSESDYSMVDTGWRAPVDAPTNVQATDGTYTDKVQIVWTASSGASYYYVYRNTTNQCIIPDNLIGSPISSPFDDTSAVPGITYYYWLQAYKAGYGVSGLSSYNTGWRVLIPPTNVQATDGTHSDKVQITWTVSLGATGYNVYRNTSNDSATASQIGTPTITSFDDTTAASNTTYWYWVKANSSHGLTAFSNQDAGWRQTENGPFDFYMSYYPSGDYYESGWHFVGPTYEIYEQVYPGQHNVENNYSDFLLYVNENDYYGNAQLTKVIYAYNYLSPYPDYYNPIPGTTIYPTGIDIVDSSSPWAYVLGIESGEILIMSRWESGQLGLGEFGGVGIRSEWLADYWWQDVDNYAQLESGKLWRLSGIPMIYTQVYPCGAIKGFWVLGQ